ncbi:hypothetical protein BJX62DRAFT_245321 [Aspergillus germanicus]
MRGRQGLLRSLPIQKSPLYLLPVHGRRPPQAGKIRQFCRRSETGATSPLIVDAISPELLDLALKDSYAYSDDAHTPAKGPALGVELQVAEQSRSLELPSLSSSSSFQPPEPPVLTPTDNSFMLDMVDFDSVLSGLEECGEGPVDSTLVEQLSVPAADSIPLPPRHLTTVASCNSCSSSRSSYQCMKNVLRLHEEVESRRSATSMAPVDQWLSFQKAVLRQCRDILGCGSCHGISEIAMLLITVCGRLLDGFHGGLGQRSGTHGPNHGPSHSSHRYNGKVLIGEYGVDCPQEQTLLISNVMELRLRDLHSVLTQLGEIAMCEGWDKHVARLHQICADVQKEIVGLRKSTEYIMDEW